MGLAHKLGRPPGTSVMHNAPGPALCGTAWPSTGLALCSVLRRYLGVYATLDELGMSPEELRREREHQAALRAKRARAAEAAPDAARR